jgi:hypothetical protein
MLGDGVPESFFDIHDEKFHTFIRDVVLEVVRGYPVDGINLDYIRSGSVCACPVPVRRPTRNLRVETWWPTIWFGASPPTRRDASRDGA